MRTKGKSCVVNVLGQIAALEELPHCLTINGKVVQFHDHERIRQLQQYADSLK